MCGNEKWDQQLSLRSRIRYRTGGESRWRDGEALHFGTARLEFLSNQLLDVGTEVVIRLTLKMQEKGADVPVHVRCHGRIISRTLVNWPEVRPAFMVTVDGCEFARE